MKLYIEVEGEEDHNHIVLENSKGYVCDVVPYELPTEEEIEGAFKEWVNNSNSISYRDVFIGGAKWIIKLIKGEKK